MLQKDHPHFILSFMGTLKSSEKQQTVCATSDDRGDHFLKDSWPVCLATEGCLFRLVVCTHLGEGLQKYVRLGVLWLTQEQKVWQPNHLLPCPGHADEWLNGRGGLKDEREKQNPSVSYQTYASTHAHANLWVRSCLRLDSSALYTMTPLKLQYSSFFFVQINYIALKFEQKRFNIFFSIADILGGPYCLWDAAPLIMFYSWSNKVSMLLASTLHFHPYLGFSDEKAVLFHHPRFLQTYLEFRFFHNSNFIMKTNDHAEEVVCPT